MKGGGVVTYVRDALIKSTDQVYEYSANLIDCLALKCTPKHNYFGKSLIIVNVYIPPASTKRALTVFFDSLIEHVGPFLVNNLFIPCGDFNRVNTNPLNLIGLTDKLTFQHVLRHS